MTDRTEATFLGGPWDMHRVWMDDLPDRYNVPLRDRRRLESARIFAEAIEMGEPENNLFKCATYRRADWIGYDSRQKIVIYVYEYTR